MSNQYPGGFITKSPVAPTSSAASGMWTLDQAMQNKQAGNWPVPLLPPFNLGASSDGGVNTFRTLGVDPVYNYLYVSDSQDPDSSMTRYSIDVDGSLFGGTTISTSTATVPKRQVAFQPPSSAQAIITGYATGSYAFYSSRSNMFGTATGVYLGSEFQSFNPWACAYTSPSLMVVSGNNPGAVSPYPSGEGIVVVNLATSELKGVVLSNMGSTGLTSGLAYDPGAKRLYVGLDANATNSGLINVYSVNNPTNYTTMSFTFIEQIDTGFGRCIEAIGCGTNYLWYGGNNYANIRRCARS